MHDFLFLLGTLAFFALMLAYISACERLGAQASADIAEEEARP